eukprot:tig00000492_g1476.t1
MPAAAKEAPAAAAVFGPLPSFEGVPIAPFDKAALREAIDDAVRLLAVDSNELKLLLRHSDLRVECKRLEKLHYLYRTALDLDPIPPGPAARMLIARHITKQVGDTCVSEEPVALLEPRDIHDEDGLGCSAVLRTVTQSFGNRVETMRIFACRRLADGSALSILVAADLDENNAWTTRGYKDKLLSLFMWHVDVTRPESMPGHPGHCRLTCQFYERRFSNWMPDWLTTQFIGRFGAMMVLRAKRLAFSTYAAMGQAAAAPPLRRAPGSFAPSFASGSAAAPLRWSSGALEDYERFDDSSEGEGGYRNEDGARQPGPTIPDWLGSGDRVVDHEPSDGARVGVPPSATFVAFPPPPPSPTPASGSLPPDVYFRTLGVGKPSDEISRGLQPERVIQLGRGQVVKAFRPPNAAALRQAEEVMRATLDVGIRFESLSLGDESIVDASPDTLFPPLEPKPRARPRSGTAGAEFEGETPSPPLGRRPLRATGAGAGGSPHFKSESDSRPATPDLGPTSRSPPSQWPPPLSGSGAAPSPRPPAPLRPIAPSPYPPQPDVPALPSLHVHLPHRMMRKRRAPPAAHPKPIAPAPAVPWPGVPASPIMSFYLPPAILDHEKAAAQRTPPAPPPPPPPGSRGSRDRLAALGAATPRPLDAEAHPSGSPPGSCRAGDYQAGAPSFAPSTF